MEELLEQANEIQEVMGRFLTFNVRSYGLPDDIDDETLEAGNYY
jgi:hypothetical protein